MAENRLTHDPIFEELTISGAKLTRVASGMQWTEGPAYFAQGDYYIWSDIPNNRVYQWQPGGAVRVFDDDPNYSNGHTVDQQGRMVSCEHFSRRVTRREHDGSTSVIADQFEGKPLNSPNDVVVKSDGSIWFTDPPYGILSDVEGAKSPQEQAGCYVFSCDASGEGLRIVSDDFVKPNGLAFSTDEKLLYVSDTGQSHEPGAPHHIRVFDVQPDGTLSGGKVFAEIQHGLPDGFRLDSLGNIWTSCATGVLCYAADGRLLGEIPVPEVVSNLVFGGVSRDQMLITATTSVYTIPVAAAGA